MMFNPSRYPEGLWHLRDELRAEDVWMRTSDGVRIHGWFVRAPAGPTPPATLYLHGNAGNLTHRADHIIEITAAGSDVLIIDYRGFGRSEGSASERGMYLDAEAGYEWLRGQGRERIVVHGESLGTAAAVDLASRREAAGVILEAPFPSARAMARRILPLLGELAAMGRLETAKKIPAIGCPLLVIHGARDGTVPIELGRRTFEAAAEPKQFWRIEGAGHADIPAAAGDEYGARLRLFYEQLE